MTDPRRAAAGPKGGSRWQRPPLILVVLAVIGASLLAVVVTTAWPVYGDEQAYWRAAERLVAGQPLYDLAALPNQPYAYWYPPVLAQVLAPLTLIVGPPVFTAFWTIVLMACLWQLSGRRLLVALAMIAFLPVALELRVRNVHLVIAMLTVLALRRSWVFWIPAAAIKIAPVVGPIYLLAAGRRREAALTAIVGAAVLAASVALSPGAWLDFIAVASSRAGTDTGGLLDLSFPVRLAAAVAIAALAGRHGGRAGEVGVIVAILLANPTLWANALSLLVAIVPLLRSRDATPTPTSTPVPEATASPR